MDLEISSQCRLLVFSNAFDFACANTFFYLAKLSPTKKISILIKRSGKIAYRKNILCKLAHQDLIGLSKHMKWVAPEIDINGIRGIVTKRWMSY